MNGMDWLRSRLTEGQRRFLKFVIVGASGVPVNLGIVYLATLALCSALGEGLRDALAYVAGIALSILTNFLLNNAWTWADRTAGDDRAGFFRRLLKFYLVSSLAAAVQFVTTLALTSLMRGSEWFGWVLHGEYRLYHVVAPLGGIAVALAINFVANHWWTFSKKEE